MNQHLPKITHVLWDWNGTLLDDLDLCIETINSILSERDLNTINREEYREKFCFPITRYYENVGLDISGDRFDKLSRLFIERYQPRSRACSLVHHSLDVLKLNRDAGIVQIILSASRRDLLETQVADAGIRDYFQELLGLGDIWARSKEEVGREWKRRAAVAGENILVVGDTRHDYVVSRALGAHFLYYSGGHQNMDSGEIPRGGGIGDLREVAEYISRINGAYRSRSVN